MNKKISLVTLGLSLSSIVILTGAMVISQPKYTLKNIVGKQSSLGDVVVYSQENRGIYSNNNLILSKDEYKFNRNVKQNPDLYKYSKEFNKNRDLFQGYVYDTDFIYSDKNSMGYIEYIDEQYGETDITLSTSIKDKNLDTGEITQFKIEIPNSLKSENNNNHKGLVTKYNGEVYIALLGEQENNPDIKMGEKDELENFVEISKVNFNSKEAKSVNNINLKIDKGEFIAIIGVNGSGKSTLAKHFNGLLLPSEGECIVDGMKVDDSEDIWKVRQKVSMVFQNPDNQIIATVVEDDIAFGPENMGIEREKIKDRIEFALKSLHIEHLRKMPPHLLSGGQKQLTAIAGAIAMRTQCIVLDEPTAMLDPQGRNAVMKALKELHEKYNITIIIITHFMEEAVQSDRIIVMNDGKIIQDGMPKDIFKQKENLKKIGLSVPLAVDIVDALQKKGLKLANVFDNENLAKELQQLICK